MIRGGRQRPRPSAGGEGPALLMLPFLDALFAALGVFVVVFAVTAIQARIEPHPPPADLLVLLDDDGVHVTVADGRSRPPARGAVYTEQAAADLLAPALVDAASRLGRPPRLVVAFGQAAIDQNKRLRRALDRLAEGPSRDDSSLVAGDPDAVADDAGLAFQVRWVPLTGDQAHDLDQILPRVLRLAPAPSES